jgi:DNA polymerase I
MKKLMLIDGSGFIFRAYHKLPPLTRLDGTPTGAVYGFTTMLLKLREDMHASHAVVVFDASSITFRNDIYPLYKANRPSPPEDLVPQFPIVRDAARALNMAVVEQRGVEADDVIATYAKVALAEGYEVALVSSDKDLMQLMAQGVTMFDPMKNAWLGLEDVEKKFGVLPDKVIEVQALMGDSVDNIPGIPGIGPKTAAQLILEYGTLENLLDHAHEIPQQKRRESLIEYREQALLSKQLVTLKDDCDNLPAIDTYAVQPIDADKFANFCFEQNFKTLRTRVEQKYGAVKDVQQEQATPAHDADYQLISTMESLHALVQQCRHARIVAFDVETTSLDATQAALVGVSLSTEAGKAYYIPLAHKIKAEEQGGLFEQAEQRTAGQVDFDAGLAVLKPLLEDAAILKIGHNIKYDMLVMRNYDIHVTSVDDTMLLSYCLGAGAHLHNMDELAERHLGIKTVAFKEVVGSGKAEITFDYVTLDAALAYAAEDADITLRLWQVLKPRVLQEQLVTVYERMERALVPVVVQMEQYGVKVDKAQLRSLSGNFATQLDALEKEIYQAAGQEFNIGSPKQLGEIIFENLALADGKKMKSGAYATGAEVLEELALQGHVLPEKVLTWRQVAKLKSTYSDALVKQIHPVTGRVHTSYSLASTSTGRLSSSAPNLQNIPIRTEQGRMIRQAFIAEHGYSLLAADYSQIELRLLAHVAKIQPLIEAFKAGKDIHAATASQMFGVAVDAVDNELRRRAKTINFGIIYGISAHGLSARLGISRGEAADYIKLYFEQYPGIKHYMEVTKEEARAHGYVTTLWGRRCYTPMINDRNPNRRAFAERAAINAPLQGSAADIIKRAMIAVHRLLASEPCKTRMLLQVHDELVFELADGEQAMIARIKKCMEQVATLDVPLVVDTGTGAHWGQAH